MDNKQVVTYAGQVAGSNYNDLDESAYSEKITYGNFAAVDYRKNEADNSGHNKNGKAMEMMKELPFVECILLNLILLE